MSKSAKSMMGCLDGCVTASEKVRYEPLSWRSCSNLLAQLLVSSCSECSCATHLSLSDPLLPVLPSRCVTLWTHFRRTHQAVRTIGWNELFERFDVDGDGEISKSEFTTIVRKECELSQEEATQFDLWQSFDIMDRDHTGTIDAGEFAEALEEDSETIRGKALSLDRDAFALSLIEIADRWAWANTPQAYAKFLSELFDAIIAPTDPTKDGNHDLEVEERERKRGGARESEKARREREKARTREELR